MCATETASGIAGSKNTVKQDAFRGTKHAASISDRYVSPTYGVNLNYCQITTGPFGDGLDHLIKKTDQYDSIT